MTRVASPARFALPFGAVGGSGCAVGFPDELLADLRQADAQLPHRRTDEEGAVIAEVHPLLHADVEQPIARPGCQRPAPMERTTAGRAAGGADDVVGGRGIHARLDTPYVPVAHAVGP